MPKHTRRLLRGIGLVCALALGATACGGSGDDSGDQKVGASDLQAALKKGGTITVWAWDSTVKSVAAEFEKKYPKVHVEVVNAGTGNDQYKALSNAISAKKGVPDVAQVEYYAIGQYSLTKGLTDLGSYGAGKLKADYSTGPWNSVADGDSVWGLPMDSGPMALFFNKKVFDKYKITVPTTWDDYLEAARKLHKANPKMYITSDVGDAGMTTSLLWQAGSHPYKVDGTNVGIDFTDAAATKYTDVWQKLIDEKLVAPVTGWTDDWYKGLGDGTIATLPIGAWMPNNFVTGVKQASGDWRVAALPQWAAGEHSSAENGGSSLAVPDLGKHDNKALAYAFTKYIAAGAGVQTRIDEGAFPATVKDLNSKEFQDTKFDYFGGQQANKIFAESAKNVPAGWSYLPYQVYANSIFNDTVGKAYVSGTKLTDGLKSWQDASVKYGKDQGFTVK
ncbi:ABC transporter substrate-binding protein [Streptomyces sp. NPDC057694]|uniref:ABC transporter substrate-binding protein n=1 Tax=Streptomyces sp. NPDC057694 TaxID=3346216 RepID=UPI0036D1C116